MTDTDQLRDDPASSGADDSEDSKRQRFDELRSGPHYVTVIAANRAYLAAAVPDAPIGAGERWALTCLPKTKTASGHRRLSAISMRNMETFVMHVDEHAEQSVPKGFVTLRRSAALHGFASPEDIVKAFGLDDCHERPYQAARPDQVTLFGAPGALANALDDRYIAGAAKELASLLTTSTTSYARYHNTYLTDAVLSTQPDA